MKNGLIIDKYGNKYHYLNDRWHREGGPAVEYTDGSKWWYLYGKLYRVNGPAIEYSNGRKEYYINDKLHREDGPAIDDSSNGNKEWYINNMRHREDGPAFDWKNAKRWYLYNKSLACKTQEEFERLMRLKSFW